MESAKPDSLPPVACPRSRPSGERFGAPVLLRAALGTALVTTLFGCAGDTGRTIDIVVPLPAEASGMVSGKLLVEYGSSGASPAMRNGTPDCISVLPMATAKFADSGTGTLSVSVRASSPLHGGADLAACRMKPEGSLPENPQEASAKVQAGLVIRIATALDADGNPITVGGKDSPRGKRDKNREQPRKQEARGATGMQVAAGKSPDATAATAGKAPSRNAATPPATKHPAPHVSPGLPSGHRPAPNPAFRGTDPWMSSPTRVERPGNTASTNNGLGATGRVGRGVATNSAARSTGDTSGNGSSGDSQYDSSNAGNGGSATPTQPPPANAPLFEVVISGTSQHADIGALQMQVEYVGGAGGFVGASTGAECSATTNALSAFNGQGPVLTVGLIALQGFSLPGELVVCTFQAEGPVYPDDFIVTVEDAANSATAPVHPAPIVEVTAVLPAG